jgi:hypothetical protein
LFHHFKIEPDSIRAEYFENSIYYTNYEVKFKHKTKKPDRVGSKRSLEEVEDETLKSIDFLGARMKKMKTQFNQVESEEEIDLMETIVKKFKNLSIDEKISENETPTLNSAVEDYFKKIDESMTGTKLKKKIAITKKSKKTIASKNLTIGTLQLATPQARAQTLDAEPASAQKNTQLSTPQARAQTLDEEPAFVQNFDNKLKTKKIFEKLVNRQTRVQTLDEEPAFVQNSKKRTLGKINFTTETKKSKKVKKLKKNEYVIEL